MNQAGCRRGANFAGWEVECGHVGRHGGAGQRRVTTGSVWSRGDGWSHLEGGAAVGAADGTEPGSAALGVKCQLVVDSVEVAPQRSPMTAAVVDQYAAVGGQRVGGVELHDALAGEVAAGEAGLRPAQRSGFQFGDVHWRAVLVERRAAHCDLTSNVSGVQCGGDVDVCGGGLVNRQWNLVGVFTSEADDVACHDVWSDGVPAWRTRVVHLDGTRWAQWRYVVAETDHDAVTQHVDVDEWVQRPVGRRDEVASGERSDRSGDRRLVDRGRRTGAAAEAGKVEPATEHRGHEADRSSTPATVGRRALTS